MIIVVTNRRVNPEVTDQNLFGEHPNQVGPDELRLATAEYDDDAQRWVLELQSEPEEVTETNRPSYKLFEQVLQGIEAGTYGCHWLFYVHGFNQSFEDSLTACRILAERYQVDVINFTWPANPGGILINKEYKRAKQAARASINALDRTLELLGLYLAQRPEEEVQRCRVSLNLLVHSLGNYLIESFVRAPIFSREMRIFDNIIFHQPDVNHLNHEQWLDKVQYGKRIYVTLNASDRVLAYSDVVNPDRLGNTVRDLTAKRPIYLDLTEGNGVKLTHNFFIGNHGNDNIYDFFKQVFQGKRWKPLEDFEFNTDLKAFQLKD